MKSVYTSSDLRSEIIALEALRIRQEADLKNAASAALESLKPVNLIKSTFQSAVKTPGFGKNILKGIAGLAAGFLSKKLFVLKK